MLKDESEGHTGSSLRWRVSIESDADWSITVSLTFYPAWLFLKCRIRLIHPIKTQLDRYKSSFSNLTACLHDVLFVNARSDLFWCCQRILWKCSGSDVSLMLLARCRLRLYTGKLEAECTWTWNTVSCSRIRGFLCCRPVVSSDRDLSSYFWPYSHSCMSQTALLHSVRPVETSFFSLSLNQRLLPRQFS